VRPSNNNIHSRLDWHSLAPSRHKYCINHQPSRAEFSLGVPYGTLLRLCARLSTTAGSRTGKRTAKPPRAPGNQGNGREIVGTAPPLPLATLAVFLPIRGAFPQ
jgi:hypothetical protein